MIATNHIDKAVGHLRGALSVHSAHEDFHSSLMVILALGQVRPLAEGLSSEEEEDLLVAEKVAVRCRILHHGHQLDHEIEAELEFRFYDLMWAWDCDASNCPRDSPFQALVKLDEILMACPVAGRSDLVSGTMPELERLFLFNLADQAEVSEQVERFLKDNPRDGKWGQLLRGIAQAKENITLAKAVMGR
jgi:hypothetical protein